ncbi:MAG: hypothetical protein KIT22_10800 [Verrucomicrobiae bacterium]|nr:hypothetical protein [Verrucomicrobiae bacterium]
MNLLDENIPLEQRDLLRGWGVRCRVIGQDIASLSIGDDDIVVLLHRLKQPTLFTRDEDFFKRSLCHPAYALMWLDVAPEEAALFVRRLLHHPRFQTKAARLGIVARVHHDGIHFWQRRHAKLQQVGWAE